MNSFTDSKLEDSFEKVILSFKKWVLLLPFQKTIINLHGEKVAAKMHINPDRSEVLIPADVHITNPLTTIYPNVEFGENISIMGGSSEHNFIVIGDHSKIGDNTTIHEGVNIETYCTVESGVTLGKHVDLHFNCTVLKGTVVEEGKTIPQSAVYSNLK